MSEHATREAVDFRRISFGPLLRISDLKEHAGKAERVFYAVHTCWWSLDPEDLGETTSGLPADPRGSVLLESSKPLDFIHTAEKNQGHYGRHGLTAFRLAYHGALLLDGKPWSFKSWDQYNEVLDALGGDD